MQNQPLSSIYHDYTVSTSRLAMHVLVCVARKGGRRVEGGRVGVGGGDEEMGVGGSCSFATCIVSRCSQ